MLVEKNIHFLIILEIIHVNNIQIVAFPLYPFYLRQVMERGVARLFKRGACFI